MKMSNDRISKCKAFAKNIIKAILLVLIAYIIFFLDVRVMNLLAGLIAIIIFYFFLEDSIKTICNKRSCKDDKDIETGVKIILGDWGSGKTYYFDNVYSKHFESTYEIKKLSCFSYNRSEFIKQIVAINFLNRWLSLNGLLSGYISFNWHNMLPKNKLIFIDDLERLPCDENMANDFIGIIDLLKKDNHVVISCSHSDIRQTVISNYLEKIADKLPEEITLQHQVDNFAIANTFISTLENQRSKNNSLALENLPLHNKDQISNTLIRLFANKWFDNYYTSDPVNLRNIKKVITSICNLDNASKILEYMFNINKDSEQKTELKFEHIRDFYIYLQVRDKIRAYLLSYELLFKCPNLVLIIKDLQFSSDVFTKPCEVTEELKKNLKSKHISKFFELKELIGVSKLKSLSFENICNGLKEISDICNMKDDTILCNLFNEYLYFKEYIKKDTNDNSGYELCKSIALHNILDGMLIDATLENNYLMNRLSKNINITSNYTLKTQEFWLCIAEHFIKKEDKESVKDFIVKIFEKCVMNSDVGNIIRFLSLSEFLGNYYHVEIDFISELLDNNHKDNWKEEISKYLMKNHTSTIDNKYYSRDNISLGHYLFELNADSDSLNKYQDNLYESLKIGDCTSELNQIIRDFTSLFPKEIPLLK